MWRWFLSWVPRRKAAAFETAGSRAWGVLTSYVRGTVVIALADALGIGAAMLGLGVPLVVSLTLLVFLGAFVPIVGSTVSGVVAVGVTFATVGPIQALLLVAAVIVVQQLEGNLLQPLVMGRALHLHPASIVLAVTVGAVLAGVLGALVAVPVLAMVYRVTEELSPLPPPRRPDPRETAEPERPPPMGDDRAGDTRQEEHGKEQEGEGQKLSWPQRRFLALLGAPAMGMALAVTVVSSYLPVLIEQISGPVLVGALIGGEGFFGIFMPTIVGGFSDRKGHACATGCGWPSPSPSSSRSRWPGWPSSPGAAWGRSSPTRWC